jgi:hypothetical protein
VIDGTSNEFFACASLSLKEDRNRTIRDPANLFEDRLHLAALFHERVFVRMSVTQRNGLSCESALGHGIGQDLQKLRDFERFDDVVKSPFLRRLNCEICGAVPCHHDDGQARMLFANSC